VLSWDWSKAGRCSTATAIVAALVRCRALGFTETVGVVVVAVLGRMSAVRLVVLFQVSSFGSKKKKEGHLVQKQSVLGFYPFWCGL
jgi:hypothetical protein